MRIEAYSDRFFLDVMRIVENFHKEAVSEYDDFLDANALIETIKREKDAGSENCFLMIVDEKCQGMIFGTRFKSMLNNRTIYQEIIWYVNPEYRGAGLKLFKQVEKILHSQGVDIMIMAVLENSKTEKLKALYEALGYRKMETHYVRKL